MVDEGRRSPFLGAFSQAESKEKLTPISRLHVSVSLFNLESQYPVMKTRAEIRLASKREAVVDEGKE